MKPEFILKADLIDIVFENRNKEYGAYELRSHYVTRLKKSISLVLLGISLVFGLAYLNSHFFSHAVSHIITCEIPDMRLTPVDPLPDIKPKPQPRQERSFTHNEFNKPKIVRAEVVNPPPTQEDLAEKILSNKNIEGDLNPGNLLPASAGTGTTVSEVTAVPEKVKILEKAEYMPEFPGGMAALQRFLSRNLKTPKEDMEPGTKTKVLARFVVDKDGSITGIVIEQSGGHDFDEEVTRVVRKMPAWKPGMQNGEKVAVYFTIPVIFQASDDN